MRLSPLYKIDSKGKVREWIVYVEGNVVSVEHGVKDGARQTKTTECSSKNIGKKNETSPEDQAILEAKSKWNKQLDKGYTEDIKDQKDKPFLPMLAHRYDQHKNKVIFPAYIQYKYNGIRSNVRNEDGIKIFSRKNKDFSAPLPHLIKQAESIYNKHPNLIIDGELYSHDLTLQKISSATKRDEPNDLSPKIEIHCYDCFNPKEPDLSFQDRIDLITELVKDLPSFIKADTKLVHTHEEVKEFHDKALVNNFEGAILRNKHAPYKVDGRSYDLLKVKSFQDDEFKIIGQKIDKNNECVFECETKEGKPFGVKIKGTREYRQQLYKENNIGKMLTIRFSEWTPDMIPFHGVGIIIRDYE